MSEAKYEQKYERGEERVRERERERERERGKITGSSQRTGREQDLFAIHIILALLSQVSLVGTQQVGWKVASSLTVFQKHFR